MRNRGGGNAAGERKKNVSQFQKDLTQGSVAKQLVLFSLPFLASNLLQALYNMADMLIVGQFCGMVGTSAVGIGGQVTILLINLISGLAVGGTVMIAQFIGAGRQEKVKHTIGTMFSLYAIAGVAMTVVMLLLAKPILNALATPAESFDEAYRYLMICMAGTIFVFGYNGVSAVLRGMGDSRHPLIFVAIAAVINVVLDIVLVAPPLNMGASGAAIATITAQAISFIISVIFLRRSSFVFDFKLKSFRMKKDLVKQLLGIGLPASLQGTLVTLSFMFLTSIANGIAGLIGSNALSIASKVNSIAILPSLAMQASVSSMVGQNIGAGKPERAKKTMTTAILIAFALSLVVFALVQFFPQPIVELFLGTAEDGVMTAELRAQCIRDSAVYLQCISWDYLLTSILFCISGLAMGVGHTLFTLINGCVSSLFIRIPAAFIMGKVLGMGLSGVGYAAPAATAVGLLVAFGYLMTGAWRRARIRGVQEN